MKLLVKPSSYKLIKSITISEKLEDMVLGKIYLNRNFGYLLYKIDMWTYFKRIPLHRDTLPNNSDSSVVTNGIVHIVYKGLLIVY